jgi:hypothetical protein
VYQPPVIGESQIGELEVQEYGHQIEAFGGYWSAKFTAAMARRTEIEDWFEYGLGRRITVRAGGGDVIWEGFVNQIDIAVAGLTATTGPLLDLANKVKLIYSTIDTSSDVPILGIRADTGYASDSASQNRYGILERVLSSGGIQTSLAAQVRDVYLAENAFPGSNNQLSFSNQRGDAPSATISCLGFVHYLNTYIYNQTSQRGMGYLSDKVRAVLNAEPNGHIAKDFSMIELNTTAEHVWENDDRLALGLIKEMVAKGDTSFNRWLFGVYAGRAAYYRAAPESAAYEQFLADPRQEIYSRGGAIVPPWMVQPGKWLLFPDFLPGRAFVDLPSDPRATFIENVSFQLPYGATINGQKVRRLDQKLARLGISGIGA